MFGFWQRDERGQPPENQANNQPNPARYGAFCPACTLARQAQGVDLDRYITTPSASVRLCNHHERMIGQLSSSHDAYSEMRARWVVIGARMQQEARERLRTIGH